MQWKHWGGAVALSVGLAACGGGASSSSSSSSSTASPATSTTAAASTTTATSAASTGSKTKTATPGTKLAVGQSATVPYRPPGTTGSAKDSTIKVTVESVEKGTLSDFNGIQLDANQKASTPAYVKVHVTNLGPHTIDVDGTSAAIQGVDNTGSTQQSVTFIGDFPRCPDKASTAPLAAGKGYDNCLTFLVPGGIAKVAYTGTDAYITSPVIWAK
jgi:hypothetical protein